MWRAGIRAAMTFAFTIFGRKVIALAGTVILLFATAILLDRKMYISAGLAGVLATAALIAFFIQYRRQIKANRIRARRQEEAAQKRAAATDARNEKMGRAKAAVSDTVKGRRVGRRVRQGLDIPAHVIVSTVGVSEGGRLAADALAKGGYQNNR